MTKEGGTVVPKHADPDGTLHAHIQKQAQRLLKDVRTRFGWEGLQALEQMREQPGHATPWQIATALHIRAELGADVFWLSEALALWRYSRSAPPPPDHSGAAGPEPSPPCPQIGGGC